MVYVQDVGDIEYYTSPIPKTEQIRTAYTGTTEGNIVRLDLPFLGPRWCLVEDAGDYWDVKCPLDEG